MLVRHRPDRLEFRLIEVLAIDVGADLHALEAELADGALQLVGRRLRRLHRQRREAIEALGVILDVLGDLVVLHHRACGGEAGILVVEKGLRRVGENVHVHVGRFHIFQRNTCEDNMLYTRFFCSCYYIFMLLKSGRTIA